MCSQPIIQQNTSSAGELAAIDSQCLPFLPKECLYPEHECTKLPYREPERVSCGEFSRREAGCMSELKQVTLEGSRPRSCHIASLRESAAARNIPAVKAGPACQLLCSNRHPLARVNSPQLTVRACLFTRGDAYILIMSLQNSRARSLRESAAASSPADRRDACLSLSR